MTINKTETSKKLKLVKSDQRLENKLFLVKYVKYFVNISFIVVYN